MSCWTITIVKRLERTEMLSFYTFTVHKISNGEMWIELQKLGKKWKYRKVSITLKKFQIKISAVTSSNMWWIVKTEENGVVLDIAAKKDIKT